jgi:ABC-type lipoprotein release transport system permease subunit
MVTLISILAVINGLEQQIIKRVREIRTDSYVNQYQMRLVKTRNSEIGRFTTLTLKQLLFHSYI